MTEADKKIEEGKKLKDGNAILEWLVKEPADYLVALGIGVVAGPEGKHLIAELGGDPKPERVGFAVGVKLRGILLPLFGAAIKAAVAGFLQDKLKVKIPDGILGEVVDTIIPEAPKPKKK
jgi:hypothetical protein